ncbi:hypothetical protein AG1IA_10355 [Rhizoctonia solani AG-1 IA]|uniref:Uncharacterized protein n=1 Tax=Thanatephorus cucumeris (strain AG1-IA) TaxID=983506 RepID=L8WCC9_THACA|nr:hypothetical protein AG1IA_10355 [Rhizoctonia solani AG-1 IA]
MHRSTSMMRTSLSGLPRSARSLVLSRGAHKEVKFSNEGRAAMLKGVDILAKAVSVTLGPKGVSGLCDMIQPYGGPKITKVHPAQRQVREPRCPPRPRRRFQDQRNRR